MPRIANSNTIPNFLVNALSKVRKAQLASLTASKPVTSVKTASVNIIPFEAVAERKLIAHGAGVYEDPETHSIWYKEGTFLKRRQEDIDRIISDYVSSIK